jgi:hypothetical protein
MINEEKNHLEEHAEFFVGTLFEGTKAVEARTVVICMNKHVEGKTL